MIVLVCGPPCVGKTTHVTEHAEPDDLVVDFDQLAEQLGSPRTHCHRNPYLEQAGQLFESYVEEIEAGEHPNAWVVRTLPDPDERTAFAHRIGADVVLVLVEDRDVLLDRAEHRPNVAYTVQLIEHWLRAYQPADVDEYAPGDGDRPAGRSGRRAALGFFS